MDVEKLFWNWEVCCTRFWVLCFEVELKRRGLYACALIKKRRYWPTLVAGDVIDHHFQSMEVGDTDTVSGTLDNVNYCLWGMKEPAYVMKKMATGGVLFSDVTCKEAEHNGKEGGQDKHRSFRYTFPVDWHFKYRHAVDDHNNLSDALPAIEDLWTTVRWEIWVFSFLLAVCKINAFLIVRYFVFQNGDIEGAPTLL